MEPRHHEECLCHKCHQALGQKVFFERVEKMVIENWGEPSIIASMNVYEYILMMHKMRIDMLFKI